MESISISGAISLITSVFTYFGVINAWENRFVWVRNTRDDGILFAPRHKRMFLYVYGNRKMLDRFLIEERHDKLDLYTVEMILHEYDATVEYRKVKENDNLANAMGHITYHYDVFCYADQKQEFEDKKYFEIIKIYNISFLLNCNNNYIYKFLFNRKNI